VGEARKHDASVELSYAVVNIDRGATLANQVSIAGNSDSRRKGLLGIDCLPEGSGIWIAPCEAVHTFGMKFAIDVVFLDRDLRVRRLVPVLAARRISVCLRASSVLELVAGAIERSNTRVGDRLEFRRLPRTTGPAMCSR
jgi:uncharacterized membrane protein (UPF0127 family)